MRARNQQAALKNKCSAMKSLASLPTPRPPRHLSSNRITEFPRPRRILGAQDRRAGWGNGLAASATKQTSSTSIRQPSLTSMVPASTAFSSPSSSRPPFPPLLLTPCQCHSRSDSTGAPHLGQAARGYIKMNREPFGGRHSPTAQPQTTQTSSHPPRHSTQDFCHFLTIFP